MTDQSSGRQRVLETAARRIEEPRVESPASARPVPGRQPDSRLALALILLIAAFGWLTMSGHTYSRDEETVFATAQSLFDRGQFALPEGLPVVEARPGVNGVGYSPFGLLQSVVLAPVYGASKLLWGRATEPYTGYASRFAAAMFNPLLHGVIAALIFLILRALRFERVGALSVALVYASATWAWPHSRTLFTEPLTTLWLLLAFYALLLASRQGGTRRSLAWYGLSGIFLALGIATRVPTALLLPVYALYALWLSARVPPDSRHWLDEGEGARSSPPGKVSRFAGFVAWGMGFTLGMLPLLALNNDLFGSPFSTGYGSQAETFLFATPLFVGLYGLVISPGKGALLYAPPLLLLFAALPIFWRRARPVTVFCAAAVVIQTLFHATVQEWPGGGVWGPRYLLPVLPFALLPLAALWGDGGWMSQAGSRAVRALRRGWVGLAIALGVYVNFMGSVVNFDTWVNSAEHDLRKFEPYYSAIAAHPRLYAERVREWSPALFPPDGVLLREGFSYSEGEGGAPLPRWTHAAARFTYNGREPVELRLRYADHRPPALPRAAVHLWVDGTQMNPPAPAGGIESEFAVRVLPGAKLELRSETWNPAQLGVNERDEDIGVRLVSIARADGGALGVAALPQVPPMPSTGFGRWAWFYRPDYHHPVDHWAWYLRASGTPSGLAVRMSLAVLLPSLACLIAGVWLLRPARAPRGVRAPAHT